MRDQGRKKTVALTTDAHEEGGGELDDAHAHVAQASLQAQGGAGQTLGEVEAGRGHVAGEGGGPDTAGEGQGEQDTEGGVVVLHREEPAEHRQDVQQGGPTDHLAGADGGGQEHVDQAQGGAGQARHRGDPVDLVLGQVEADVVEPGCHRTGQEPDGEAEHEGEGGNSQSGPGDLRGPVLRLLGVPPCEDATGGVKRGHRAPAVCKARSAGRRRRGPEAVVKMWEGACGHAPPP